MCLQTSVIYVAASVATEHRGRGGPDMSDSGNWLGKLLKKVSQRDLGAASKSGHEPGPHDMDVWTNRGGSLDVSGYYGEAISCLDKALELDPRDAGAWSDKGFSLCSLGRFDEATHCYDKALEFDPRNVQVWLRKAATEDVLSHWREAARSYQQFLTLAPAQQYAKEIEGARQRLQELGG